MSRFGIRNKLKQAFGKQRKEIVRHAVTYVLPDGSERVVEAEERYNLLMASQNLPSQLVLDVARVGLVQMVDVRLVGLRFWIVQVSAR